MSVPRLLPCGDTALSVDFGDVIDFDVNAKGAGAAYSVVCQPYPGVVETVTTYRALMVHFDPLATYVEA
jgi:allophanate hydrolase subunit 1